MMAFINNGFTNLFTEKGLKLLFILGLLWFVSSNFKKWNVFWLLV